MYSKYKDISKNIKDFQTCSICHERPIFICKDDLSRHILQYHTTKQNEDERIESKIESLKQDILNPDLVIGRRRICSSPSIKDLEEQRLKVENISKKLQKEVEDLQHSSDLKSVSMAKLKEDMDRLAYRIGYKSREIDYLQQEKQRIERLMVKCKQDENTPTLSREEKLNSWLCECNSEARSVVNSMYQHTRKYEKGEREFVTEVDEKYQLKEELERVSHKMNVLQVEFRSLEKNRNVYKQEYLTGRKHEGALKEKLEAALMKLEKREYQLKKYPAKIKALKDEILVKDAEIKRLQKHANQHQTKMDEIQKLSVEKVKEVSSLITIITTLTDEKNKLKNAIDDVEQRYKDVESQLKTGQLDQSDPVKCSKLQEKYEALQTELSSLKVCHQRDSIIQNVQEENDAAEKNMSEMKIKHTDSELQGKYEALQKDLSALKVCHQSCDSIIKNLNDKKDAAEKNMSEMKSKHADSELQGKYEALQKDLSALKKCHQSCDSIKQNLKDEKDAAEKNTSQVKSKHADSELQGKYEALQKDLSALKVCHQSCDSIIQNLNNEKDAAEKKISEMKSKHADSELQGKYEALQKDLSALKMCHQSCDSIKQNLKDEKDAAVENMSEMKSKHTDNELQVKYEALQKDLSALKISHQSCDSLIQNLKDEKDAAEKNTSQVKNKSADSELQEKYEALHTELNSIKDTHKTCNSVIQSLKDKEKEEEEKIISINKEVVTMKTELEKTKKQLDLVKRSSQQDFVENRAYKKQVAELRKKLESKTKECNAQKEKVVELSKNICQLQSDQNNADVENSTLMNRIQDGDKEIDQFQRTISDLEIKLAEEVKQKNEMTAENEKLQQELKTIRGNGEVKNLNEDRTIKKEYELISDKLKEKTKLISDTETELEQSKQDGIQLRKDISDLNQTLNEAYETLEHTQKKANEDSLTQQQEIQILKQDNNLKKQNVKDLLKKVQNKKSDEFNAQEKKLKNEVELLSEELTARSKLLSKTQTELETSEENVTKLVVELSHLHKQLDDYHMGVSLAQNNGDEKQTEKQKANLLLRNESTDDESSIKKVEKSRGDLSMWKKKKSFENISSINSFNKENKEKDGPSDLWNCRDSDSSTDYHGDSDVNLPRQFSSKTSDNIQKKKKKTNKEHTKLKNKISENTNQRIIGEGMSAVSSIPSRRLAPLSKKSSIGKLSKLPPLRGRPHHDDTTGAGFDELKKLPLNKDQNMSKPDGFAVKRNKSSVENMSPLSRQHSFEYTSNFNFDSDSESSSDENIDSLLAGLDEIDKKQSSKQLYDKPKAK